MGETDLSPDGGDLEWAADPAREVRAGFQEEEISKPRLKRRGKHIPAQVELEACIIGLVSSNRSHLWGRKEIA